MRLVEICNIFHVRMAMNSMNVKERQSPITKMLEVSEWAISNIYIKHLVKKYGKGIRNIISSGIQSYIKRVVPKFRMDSITKINDDIIEIAMYFKAATQFIRNVLVDGESLFIANAPYQVLIYSVVCYFRMFYVYKP